MVLVVLETVNACVLVVCVVSVVLADCVKGTFLCGFNFWNIPGFIFNLVVAFNFSIALSQLLPIDLICSQVHI